MPIYEYKCEDCGTVTELLQKMSDKPLKKCPKCAGNVVKIISRSSFQLKGSGWYVSDYGKGTGGTAGIAKKSNSPDEGSKSPDEGSKASDEGSKSEKKSESSASETKSKPKKSSAKGGD